MEQPKTSVPVPVSVTFPPVCMRLALAVMLAIGACTVTAGKLKLKDEPPQEMPYVTRPLAIDGLTDLLVPLTLPPVEKPSEFGSSVQEEAFWHDQVSKTVPPVRISRGVAVSTEQDGG